MDIANWLHSQFVGQIKHSKDKIMTEGFGKWLLQDDQKALFEIVFAVILNISFLVLIALLFWPLARILLVVELAKGYGLLWTILLVTLALIHHIHQLFRINLYERFDAYLVSNLLMSCFLQAGWSAFAAQTVQTFMVGAPGWILVVLYLVGGFSCLVAFYAVSAFYYGHIYRLISLPVALLSFLVFNIWPSSAHALYGWLFDLF